MKILAIIPARGGSKGIPRKNITPIGGKPLLAWSIEAAKESKYINRIVVSTDDNEIEAVAKANNAEVVQRPSEISGDSASSESAIIHCIEYLEKNENYKSDLVVFLQATSPLTTYVDIDNCIDTLLNENADSATTISDFHYFIWKKNDLNEIEGINHNKSFRPRRQDREDQFIETGAVYIFKTEGFLKAKHRFFGKTVGSYMPPERVFEIDEPIDFKIAEILLKEQLILRKKLALPQAIEAVLFDFDGVMTDNKVIVSEDGKESVVCDRSDGMGISQLKKLKIKTAVLSTEVNPVVSARCKKLSLECYQGLRHNKEQTLIEWCEENNINKKNVVYMGNDINDIECMKLVGCSVVPSDAHPKVTSYANIVLDKKGGNGAVRNLCDLITENFK